MKKGLSLVMFCLLAMVVSGCMSFNNGNQALQTEMGLVPTKYRPIYDVDTTQAVEGQATHNVLFLFFSWGDNNFSERGDYTGNYFNVLSRVRRAATYNACAQVGCDALVGCTYTTKYYSNPFFTQVVCTVKGFPAKLKGVEEVASDDYKVIKRN